MTRAWAVGDVCRIERTVCIVADVDTRNDLALLVSLYPGGWDGYGWRPVVDLKTAYANVLRRTITALEREQTELANRIRLVKLELSTRKVALR